MPFLDRFLPRRSDPPEDEATREAEIAAQSVEHEAILAAADTALAEIRDASDVLANGGTSKDRRRPRAEQVIEDYRNAEAAVSAAGDRLVEEVTGDKA